MSDNPLRHLPSVDALVGELESSLPRPLLVAAARIAIDIAREHRAAGRDADPRAQAIHLVRSWESSAGKAMVNATGVLLHTNLGRAPWSERAISRAADAAAGYRNVEIDLETGERGRRGGYAERLLCELTGAEAAFVVNNNAAALFLALSAIGAGRAVPVSRGELVEIGGSYRLPDMMGASGAEMVEVGTTNRTRAGDYLTALDTHVCGAILKVHTSNYRVEGFTEEATIPQLAVVAHEKGVPLLFDQGSGLLDAGFPWLPAWIRSEPGVRQALEAGADLVTFSGDKLLGGPQAGLVVGAERLVSRVRDHPLSRALRVDGVTYAALAATLEAYLEGGVPDLPLWRMALESVDVLHRRSETLATESGGNVEDGESAVGAGSAPGVGIPSPVIRYRGGQALFDCLLRHQPPVLARREAGDLLVDLRTVPAEADMMVAEAIVRCR